MNIYQKRYWELLKELKTHVIYLQIYASRSDNWDKTINIFLAITSSSSIAAWAIWQKYQIIWAVLIALSQVITVIIPFLPHKKRLKAISELNDKIQEISLECEKNWFSVSEGLFTEKEIHELTISLKDKSFKAEKRYLKNLVLPKKNTILSQAEEDADLYFTNNYLLKGEIINEQSE